MVDTSVWVDHLRRGNPTLVEMLEETQVWTHEFVIGELACGRLVRRSEVLDALVELPRAPLASHEEVMAFIVARRLMGRGLGWIDLHLLASAALAKLPLWTVDKRLSTVAAELNLGN